MSYIRYADRLYLKYCKSICDCIAIQGDLINSALDSAGATADKELMADKGDDPTAAAKAISDLVCGVVVSSIVTAVSEALCRQNSETQPSCCPVRLS